MVKIIKFPTPNQERINSRTAHSQSKEEINWNSPLERSLEEEQLNTAQEIIYDAWEADNPEKKIELAQKALTLFPNCIDAYNLLAYYSATTYEESLKLYNKGLAMVRLPYNSAIDN